MRNLLLATILCFSIPLISCGDNGPIKAWWYESEIKTDCAHPDTGYLIYEDDCFLLLSTEVLGSIDGFSQMDVEKYRLEYRLLEDINMDGKQEYIAVAVYSDGERNGRALIIANNQDLSAIERVFKVEGISGFSALTIVDGKVRWYFCMECGHYYTVGGTTNGYFLE